MGTRIYNQKTGEFNTSFGPVFTNLLLADEINRAPAKVQSALLEVMQERQVTIGPKPFLCPIRSSSWQPKTPLRRKAPILCLKRKWIALCSRCWSAIRPTEEFVIVERMTGTPNDVVPLATTEQLSALQRECQRVYVDPALKQYAVRLASATRDPDRFGVAEVAKYISFGVSPRASINLIEGARALAFLRGRTYVLSEDVMDLVLDVFRHRLVLNYEALAEGIAPDHLIRRIMEHIPAPEKPLESHVRLGANL